MIKILKNRKKFFLILKKMKSIIGNTKLQKIEKKNKLKPYFIKINKNNDYSIFLKKFSFLKFFSNLRFNPTLVRKPLKQKFKKSNKFLTKRLRKILIKFPKNNIFFNQKLGIKKKLRKMSNISRRTKLRRNLSKRTYFFRILRKKRRRKIKVVRLNRLKPIFTKKTKKEKKFLIKARESLLKTKKFLYRKQFPKIKGRKNKNFNFYYYNNMDRIPFKFHIGRIVITYLINNTFINIHSSKKMLKVLSAGKIGFKGPKRSTPYSRQVVARKAIKFIAKTKLNVLDVFLNSNYNRWYYFLFKEISKPRIRPYVIRYLIISNPRSHGFIRDRKHRRK